MSPIHRAAVDANKLVRHYPLLAGGWLPEFKLVSIRIYYPGKFSIL